jgi:hypothetical protein
MFRLKFHFNLCAKTGYCAGRHPDARAAVDYLLTLSGIGGLAVP